MFGIIWVCIGTIELAFGLGAIGWTGICWFRGEPRPPPTHLPTLSSDVVRPIPLPEYILPAAQTFMPENTIFFRWQTHCRIDDGDLE
jgi:hypothetical protein